MKLKKGQLFKAFYGYATEEGFFRIETLIFDSHCGTSFCYHEGEEMFDNLIFLALEEVELSLSGITIVPAYAIGLNKVGFLEYENLSNLIVQVM